MRIRTATQPGRVASLRATVAASILLAAAMLGCTGGDGDTDQRLAEIETKVQSLEESLEAAEEENAELRDEIAALRGDRDGVADGDGPADAGAAERLDDIDSRLAQVEVLAALVQEAIARAQDPSADKDDARPPIGGSVEERTTSSSRTRAARCATSTTRSETTAPCW